MGGTFLTDDHTYQVPKHPDTEVQLTGQDGNAFAIIANVASALRREVGFEESKAWQEFAMESNSYEELLRRASRTVSVS